MTAHIDPDLYLRFPKPDVEGALTLSKILLQRVPECSPPGVHQAASILEEALVDLREKWVRQAAPASRDMRPQARRLAAAWSAIRDRLVAYDALPEGHADRTRASSIHETLFPDGLDVRVAFSHLHARSERRLMLVDERGLAEDLARLVGEHFLAAVRTAFSDAGDALGVNKAPVASVPVFVAEPLRVLTEAISGYALQLLAIARLDPTQRDAVVFALTPIDEYRASLGRRVSANDDEDEDEDDPDDPVVDVVTTPPANTPAVPLAPVA